ncbi:DUF3137 domain-containing protein [Maribacter sp. MMG018]|uniref:DUF3137 domain-containing protein n=1 Tax=Maribacter sp. MMG018 TaxID=2822688 RepID=UPI001B377A63|nr:DUF3137 domain-containing protein [Maribacter sp. MMG018]MBQ4912829.1 DUF3137 domain-containing protein [Maribacter sp. MMG018]
MQERIVAAYSETSKVLDTLYKKKKRTLFLQRVMWGITGMYLIFMLALLGIQYIPMLENTSLAFLDVFKPTPTNPYASLYPIMGLMVLLYPTTIFFTRAFQKFKTTEQKTIAKMVKMLFPQVEFTQGAMAPTNEVAKSKLFPWIKEEAPVYSYGQIRGRTNDTEINITDLGIVENNVANKFLGILMRIPVLNMLGVMYQTVFKNMVTKKLADNTNYSFRGMFCWLRFKKKLNGHTVVLSKNQMTKLDRLASFNFKEEQEIHLEDPRFTSKFMVYGTDQVEARYVLSASIMEKIVALKEEFDRPISMSFQNRQMYMAVKNANGLFSFPSGKLDSIKLVEELANDIETALEISEELKL